MIGICRHISADIIIYWPIYENTIILYDILTDICLNLENKNFHISLKKWKISTYIDQNIIFEKNHISVNIPLSYIGQYIIFNIDRYILTYSGQYKPTSLKSYQYYIYRSIYADKRHISIHICNISWFKLRAHIGPIYIRSYNDWYIKTYILPVYTTIYRSV